MPPTIFSANKQVKVANDLLERMDNLTVLPVPQYLDILVKTGEKWAANPSTQDYADSESIQWRRSE